MSVDSCLERLSTFFFGFAEVAGWGGVVLLGIRLGMEWELFGKMFF